MSQEKLVLIDTDAGLDDAWAIFLCAQAHKDPNINFRLLAITCTHGNTTVDNVTVNVTRILQSIGESDNIPVYRGCESALVLPFTQPSDPWHGQDGFGDAGFPPIPPKLAPDHSVNVILELIQLYPGKLTILALGPLTNLAMAIRLNPSIRHMIKDVYALGGNHTGLGNTSPSAEFNFMADCEAAHICLENLCGACPFYIVPWETCLQATSEYAFRVETLGSIESGQVTLMNQAEAKNLAENKENWMEVDALAAAILIESSAIKKMERHYTNIELSGRYARGLMIVDKSALLQKPKNSTIIMEVDLPLIEKMLIWAAGGPHYK